MSDRTILVDGSTGSVGARVVAGLAARGLRVRAAMRPETRRAPRAAALQGPLIEPVVVNPFDAASWESALEGADTVVSTLGASVALGLRGRQSYDAVDAPAPLRLFSFAVAASTSDAVAPAFGSRTLLEHYAARLALPARHAQ